MMTLHLIYGMNAPTKGTCYLPRFAELTVDWILRFSHFDFPYASRAFTVMLEPRATAVPFTVIDDDVSETVRVSAL
jgi:hypothetical protein